MGGGGEGELPHVLMNVHTQFLVLEEVGGRRQPMLQAANRGGSGIPPPEFYFLCD